MATGTRIWPRRMERVPSRYYSEPATAHSIQGLILEQGCIRLPSGSAISTGMADRTSWSGVLWGIRFPCCSTWGVDQSCGRQPHVTVGGSEGSIPFQQEPNSLSSPRLRGAEVLSWTFSPPRDSCSSLSGLMDFLSACTLWMWMSAGSHQVYIRFCIEIRQAHGCVVDRRSLS